MRFSVLLGLIGLGLAGCNGAPATTSATDVAARTNAPDSTGSHIHGRVGSASAQSVNPDAVYGASGGLSGGSNGNGPVQGH
ncbi:MAG: hypothetical protein JWO51_2690 [Rhodospirillales bacterium]|nr:hypothetical protein [Rhodospirillales bacterium]